ncbi:MULTISPECIES: Glu/Leu/Phe/Val dehydrogenase family protein [unclassified Paenibacillus]|uniref:Glu/Leu/Phe/Val dehydrogenase family protein n=1 Tax=unclassified Paenibacillus TaxID=185978 RepID=UPI0009A7ED39|nr:Glutamate dehydrogenase/leucine dehydrogenase [Paenibacillus sp. RU5A]SOC70210.1 Glutamate dehydrogenase/leucine dehydrogenase [Paenibacillus sp. RU26A]SOC72373.1 Glutamate dehydrogenase/leucine dehydrogenase [Paenibacillus sp. RU5M]
MQLWHEMQREGMEELIFCHDPRSGLKAVIAIHSTVLGPAIGGCRCWTYASEEEAVRDAIKLAKGMTYKSTVSGLPYGGGKAVVWDVPAELVTQSDEASPDNNLNPRKGKQDVGLQANIIKGKDTSNGLDKGLDKTSKNNLQACRRAETFRSLGRYLERLNGRYVTGLDLGTTAADMDQIRLETVHVTDTTGSLGAQDDFTAEMTAYGVYTGIVTSLRHQGIDALQGISVAVQGLGKVGYALCRYLHAAGARLIVADVVPERVQRALVQFSGAISADPAHIHTADCKVFAPCALGGVLTPATVEELRCSIVAGAANNQLSHRELVVRRMQARGILYAPDYVLNAGGIISTAYELEGAGPDLIRQKVAGIAGTLSKVYAIAKQSALSTADAADQLAEAVLQSGKPHA